MSDPSPDDVYTVSITVLDGTVQAMDLNANDGSGKCDAYVCAQVAIPSRDKAKWPKMQTAAKKKTLTPVWDRHRADGKNDKNFLEFQLTYKEILEAKVNADVWDKDLVKDEWMGKLMLQEKQGKELSMVDFLNFAYEKGSKLTLVSYGPQFGLIGIAAEACQATINIQVDISPKWSVIFPDE